MYGFTDKCLILFPKRSSYNIRGEQFKYLMEETLQGILLFLEKYSIKPCAITTDETAVDLYGNENFEWFDLLTPVDKNFASRYCGINNNLCKDPNALYKEYALAVKKFPVNIDADLEERVKELNKREQYVWSLVQNNFKFIVDLQVTQNRSFKVKVKKGDQRFILTKADNTFNFTAIFSGDPVNPYLFINDEVSKLDLSKWKEYLIKESRNEL